MKRIILIVACLCAWLAGCSSSATTVQNTLEPGVKPTPTFSGTPEMVIKMEVFGENPHPLGGMAMLLSLQPNVDAPNTNVTITMPSDLNVITGSKAWAGDLKANQGLFLNIMVQIDSLKGPGFIQVDSISYPKNALKLAKTYKLYLRPTADGKNVEFSQMPFGN
jgi:hypothetical protein